ncbi:hypothetical protein KC723_02175 [Candidatus Kaiserbacteria bacterium]|nr:hypothetical protein [Candidatus Kaiserbacteria bacterium]
MTVLHVVLIWFAGMVALRVYIYFVTETFGCAKRFPHEYHFFTWGMLDDELNRFIYIVLWPLFVPARLLYLTIETIAGWFIRLITGSWPEKS